MMDRQGRGLSETVWTRLDRKAGAITELTIRQLRNRLSTWVVLAVSFLLLVCLLALFIGGIRDGWEPIDNDNDSHDWDGDGYPAGQEYKYGSNANDPFSFPGSGDFVQEGYFEWGGVGQHSGNHTWRYVTGTFTYNWIENNPIGGETFLDVSNLDDCPEGEMFDDFWLDWGSGCSLSQNSILVHEASFTGNGTFRTQEGWGGVWGYMEDVFYVEPEPASNYIDEDDIDWTGDPNKINGFDDDGDCLRIGWPGEPEPQWWWENRHDPDRNENGIDCDVQWILDSNGNVVAIYPDDNVDEDPSEENLAYEDAHRAFIIGTGKIAFVMILGIFLPLFLALGLVRDETENGTLHYLLSKPIHRGEFITYRILGYLIVAGGFVLIMSLLMGLVTASLGPGDSIFRLKDVIVWLGIAFATILALAAYGAIFNTLGLLSSRYGVYIALVIGVYEFVMAVLTLGGAELIPVLSVSHWTLQLIDSIVLIVWPNTIEMHLIATAFELPSGITAFWNPPVHTLGTESPFVSGLISVIVLMLITSLMILFGQRQFKRREIM